MMPGLRTTSTRSKAAEIDPTTIENYALQQYPRLETELERVLKK